MAGSARPHASGYPNPYHILNIRRFPRRQSSLCPSAAADRGKRRADEEGVKETAWLYRDLCTVYSCIRSFYDKRLQDPFLK